MTDEPKPNPNTVERDKTGTAQGITARCHLCPWTSGGHFSGSGASAAKMDHMERAHGRS